MPSKENLTFLPISPYLPQCHLHIFHTKRNPQNFKLPQNIFQRSRVLLSLHPNVIFIYSSPKQILKFSNSPLPKRVPLSLNSNVIFISFSLKQILRISNSPKKCLPRKVPLSLSTVSFLTKASNLLN